MIKLYLLVGVGVGDWLMNVSDAYYTTFWLYFLFPVSQFVAVLREVFDYLVSCGFVVLSNLKLDNRVWTEYMLFYIDIRTGTDS